jgi:hypothetical protein
MARRALAGFAGLLAALGLILFLGDLPGDDVRLRGRSGLSLLVVDHGYHSGLILPRAALAERARALGLTRLGTVADRFVAYDHVEVGWGDEGFYRNVPGLSLQSLPHALRALFATDNRSVLHVVGIMGPPAAYFAASDMVRLGVDGPAFDRVAVLIDDTLAPDAENRVVVLGPGLYGPSLFFGAVGTYHLTRNCNHWIARLVNAAGRPVSLGVATLSAGLMADLRWRGGARRP